MDLDRAVERSRAVNRIRRCLRPGDVINCKSDDPWYALLDRVAHKCIRVHQERIFGKNARTDDTHTMIYLDDRHTLSVEPPRVCWAEVFDYCLGHITIYRYVHLERILRQVGDRNWVFDMMKCAGAIMEGRKYDYGNHILGYPQIIRHALFDLAFRRKVCSVGVRIVFEHLRHRLEERRPDVPMDRLFSRINLQAWKEAGKIPPAPNEQTGKLVDVEATAPAHFANSRFYAGEFELVAEFDRGVIVRCMQGTPVCDILRL